jgi:IS5 family transposase
MDGELLRYLYHRLFDSDRGDGSARCVYSDAVILFIYAIAALSGKSPRWARQKRNWPLWARRVAVPSYSQLMRRVKTPEFLAYWRAWDATFRAALPSSAEKCVDGKPLVVGSYSKDPDARWGYLAANTWGRGYKIHAVSSASGVVEAFTVTPLNAGEATVAAELVQSLDLREAVVRGDANYDSNPLYATVAARGGRLLAPRRRPGTGLSARPHHPDRLRAIAELECSPGAAQTHARHRVRIEQTFGHLTNLPFGLSPLPNFVRRLNRVTLWVTAKIALYHLHLALKHPRTNAA